MADKFIRHGATFNGDGTSSALATVDGGVGAWNNINILEGTAPAYGVLTAGNTVFIRSKDESGADIVRTLAATVTLGMAGLAGPAQCVTWVLDNGSVWPGIDGVLTHLCPSTYVVAFAPNNRFRCETPEKWAVIESNTAASAKAYGSTGNVEYEGLLFDYSAAVSSFGCGKVNFAAAVQTYKSCRIKIGKNTGAYAFFGTSYLSTIRLISTNIELTLVDNSQALFYNSSDGLIEIIGGSVSGVGATTGKLIFWSLSDAQTRTLIGFKYPKTMTLCGSYTGSYGDCGVSVVASDGAAGGAYFGPAGFAESRLDQYYSTLNARLPDSASTPWSWFIYPSRASKLYPMQMASSLLYTETAATKTITLELLVANTFTGVDRSNLYLLVTYTDNGTGLSKCITTRIAAGGPLDTSTAGWSSATYGPTGFDKCKLSLTTPTSIKQDTLISAVLVCELASSSGGDTLIMDPDFTVA